MGTRLALDFIFFGEIIGACVADQSWGWRIRGGSPKPKQTRTSPFEHFKSQAAQTHDGNTEVIFNSFGQRCHWEVPSGVVFNDDR